MKESYQEVDDKNEDLRDYLATYRDKGQEFLDRYEMSSIYRDSALEGAVHSSRELNAALHGGATKPMEASTMPLNIAAAYRTEHVAFANSRFARHSRDGEDESSAQEREVFPALALCQKVW